VVYGNVCILGVVWVHAEPDIVLGRRRDLSNYLQVRAAEPCFSSHYKMLTFDAFAQHCRIFEQDTIDVGGILVLSDANDVFRCSQHRHWYGFVFSRTLFVPLLICFGDCP
jgi:hypothetical protein